MQKFGSVNEALDFAISEEQQARDFYLQLALASRNPGMRKTFEQFAREEEAHKGKLEGVKSGKTLLPAHQRITNLRIADYLVQGKPSQEMRYQDALLLAMSKEKAAYRMYVDLAEAASDEGLRALFLSLAQEEANHKLRFELEYDSQVLREN
jgi:rubrerythrin